MVHSLSRKLLAHFRRRFSSQPSACAESAGVCDEKMPIFFLFLSPSMCKSLINIMGINLCMSLSYAEAALCMMHLYAFRVYIVCKSVTVD